MTNAVNCLDGPWPANWNRWHRDHTRQYQAGQRFLTWTNAWYNAPCASWPEPSRKKPAKVGNSQVAVLLVQPEFDTAHGVEGAVETHRLFPNSRLVLEREGHNVGAALSANNNACLNQYVGDFLRDGTRPASRKGTDAVCQASPTRRPDPPVRTGRRGRAPRDTTRGPPLSRAPLPRPARDSPARTRPHRPAPGPRRSAPGPRRSAPETRRAPRDFSRGARLPSWADRAKGPPAAQRGAGAVRRAATNSSRVRTSSFGVGRASISSRSRRALARTAGS